MDRAEAEARMREVQRIMERTTLFTLMPGLPAILGGALVLAGCGVSYAMLRSLDFGVLVRLSEEAQWAFCSMWTAIGVISIAYEVIWTAGAARAQGLSPTARPFRFAAFSLSPSLFVAFILTFRLLIDATARPPEDYARYADYVRYIVPLWMMCYGTGVYTAGLFSIRLPRVLGLSFLALGAIALLYFPRFGMAFAALSFGLLHVLFGVYIVRKSKRAGSS